MNEPSRILVVDLETSDLDPVRSSILQIGAKWLIGEKAGEEFSMDCRMWKGANWSEKSEAIHGISFIRANDPSLPTEAEAVQKLFEWEGDDTFVIAGLTPSYDSGFLKAGVKRAGLGRYIPHRTLDLHSLAVAQAVISGVPVPLRGFYTDEVYALLGLPPEPTPHRAITGAQRETEAFKILLHLV